MTTPALFSLTPSARQRLEAVMQQRTPRPLGIRISVKQRGCSGKAYHLEYVEAPNPLDERLQSENLDIFIDPKAVLFVIGTEMDYVETDLESGFIFRNPNEKGRCGCGESFHV